MKTLLVCLGTVLAGAGAAMADTIPLNEVTVVASRHADPVLQAAPTVNIITASDIAASNAQTMADVLAADGRLTVQKSQQGGGSPVIRGLESSRVLLVVDGVKLNNLIYRSGHLQNVLSVDPSSLERAEVLYGPGSVLYGSDAMGGVLAFGTRRAQLDSTSFNGWVRGASANGEGAGHVDLNIGGKRWASMTSVTYSHYGNLHAGRRRNPFMPKDNAYITSKYYVVRRDGRDEVVENPKPWVQMESGYWQADAVQKLMYSHNDNSTHHLNLQFSTTGDVPRYDRLTDMKGSKPKFAQWYYGPQQRVLGAYTWNGNRVLGADYATATVAWQNVKESRHNRKLNDVWLGSRMENVNVLSVNTDWVRTYGQHRLHAGIDGSLQWLHSTARRRNVDTGAEKAVDTRYPDGGNRMHGVDVFVAYQRTMSPKLRFDAGVRGGYSYLQSVFDDDTFFPIFKEKFGTVTQRNATYSLNAALTYNPADSWKTSLSVATGYRVPNVDDLGKIFDSQPGMVVVPNPHIKPEKNISIDINTAHMGAGNWTLQASAYVTYLFDAISLAPATVDGKTHIMYDGEDSRVYANSNFQRAYVTGFSATAGWKPLSHWSASATATYTYGNILATDNTPQQPMDHVAPLHGRVGIEYRGIGQDRLTVEGYTLFNGSKPLSRYNLNGEDNIVYATVLGDKANGLPAWFTLNLRATFIVNSHLTVQASAENMLDTEYRTFASGINAPGRSLTATLRVSL